MRKRIYELVEVSQEGDKLSAIYDYLMMIAIVALPAGIITAGYMTEIQSHKANSFTDDI